MAYNLTLLLYQLIYTKEVNLFDQAKPKT
uniref:Uncharacterized protein n=1 Tax=Tetranychus urticae TaxID=32264 RepID=T1K9I4_TETUR